MKLRKVIRHREYKQLNYIKNTPYVFNLKSLKKSLNPKEVLHRIWKEDIEIKINEDI